MIKLIWAMDRNFLVGKGNMLPWHYKEDLLFFKNHTHQKTVLMGERTYWSLKGYYPNRPLPFGTMYVASLGEKVSEEVNHVPDMVAFLKEFPKNQELYVIGGKTVYELALPFADVLYVTVIDADHEGDVYFSKTFSEGFALIDINKKGILEFRIYERKEKCL